jgi:hypothetical protein
MFDSFDGAKPRFLNRGKKRRSVSTLSIPRASDRGVEWVDSESNVYFGSRRNGRGERGREGERGDGKGREGTSIKL